MSSQKKWLIVAGVSVLALVLIVGSTFWTTSDDGGDVPTDSISAAVHESVSGYSAGLARDFASAAIKVEDGTLKTDAELQAYLVAATAQSRAKAFGALDMVIQEQLPRKDDKLEINAPAFLNAIAKAFSRESEHKHD